jgi:Na+/phosphate symporter
MKKFPSIALHQLVPYALALSALGFCLMQADELRNVGAILLPIGLLPLAILLFKLKD